MMLEVYSLCYESFVYMYVNSLWSITVKETVDIPEAFEWYRLQYKQFPWSKKAHLMLSQN